MSLEIIKLCVLLYFIYVTNLDDCLISLLSEQPVDCVTVLVAKYIE